MCLTKATLDTIPNYYMQALSMPMSVKEEMNRTMNRFIWAKSDNSKGVQLVGWDHMQAFPNYGGKYLTKKII